MKKMILRLLLLAMLLSLLTFSALAADDFAITSQPRDVFVSAGASAKFTVAATGAASYQWQFSNNNGATWQNSSNTSASMSFSATAERHGRMVRCVIRDPGGVEHISEAARLYVSGSGPVVYAQPQYFTAPGDSGTASFALRAYGWQIHYQWQNSRDGTTWTNLPDQTSDVCTYAFTAGEHGMRFRCVITDSEGIKTTSDPAGLIVPSMSAIKILSQPKDVVCGIGDKARFSVTAEGEGLSYQWQFSSDGGAVWTDSSVKRADYSLDAEERYDGRLLRCLIVDASGERRYSETARLTIATQFEIYVQPEDAYAAMGDSVSFTVQAGGTGVSFRWEMSADGETGWQDVPNVSSAATSSMKRNMSPSGAGYYYRCVLTDETGEIRISEPARALLTDRGFVQYEGKTYCAQADGTLARGLTQIGSDLYYFNEYAEMTTGFRTIDGKGYYFEENGVGAKGFRRISERRNRTYYFGADGAAVTGWQEIDGDQYYFYGGGAMAHGLTQIGTHEYYFDFETGARRYGLISVGLKDKMLFLPDQDLPETGLREIDGELYCFSDQGGSYGVALDGLQTVSGETYYFDEATKAAVTGFVEDRDSVYCMGEDHRMLTGLQTVNGALYDFSSGGRMLYGLQTVDGALYWFDENTGAARSGWYVDDGGERSYFDPDTCTAVTGMQEIGGRIYYFNSSGIMQCGLRSINNVKYYFSEDCSDTEAGFRTINGQKYYIREDGSVATGMIEIDDALYLFRDSGVMRTGLVEKDGVRYYFDPQTGAAVRGLVTMENGNTYLFDGASGACSGLTEFDGELYHVSGKGILLNGRVKLNGAWYLFAPDTGRAASGWRTITVSSGNVYRSYFDPVTHQAAIGWKNIDGADYYFNDYGYALTGRQTINDIRYWLDGVTGEALTGWQEVNGSLYYYRGIDGRLTGPGTFEIDGVTCTLSAAGALNTALLAPEDIPVLPENAETWLPSEEGMRYLNSMGEPVTGLQVIENAVYVFGADGLLRTGFQNEGTCTYYVTESGALSGMQQIDGDTYYFNPVDRVMQRDLLKLQEGLYDFAADGKRQTGWIRFSEQTYYLSDSGSLVTGPQQIGGEHYLFSSSGVLLTGIQRYTDIDGTERVSCFDADGIRQSGWVTMGEKLYYFDPETGDQLTGLKTVGGQQYYFIPSTGAAASGLVILNGSRYAFDSETHQRLFGLQRVNGRLYYFSEDASGGVLHGLQVIDGKTYYFRESTGVAEIGRCEIDSVVYYFDPETGASADAIYRNSSGRAFGVLEGGGLASGMCRFMGKTYYFCDSDGHMAEGLCSVGDTLYCFTAEDGMLSDCEVQIAGVSYAIDKDGAVSVMGDSVVSRVIRAGLSRLGAPYGTDDEHPDVVEAGSYTCSQLVAASMTEAGIPLCTTVFFQYESLLRDGYDITLIDDISKAQPGDLLYFCIVDCIYGEECTFWNEFHHVSIYMGEGKALEATSTRGCVTVQDYAVRPGNFIYAIVRVNGMGTASGEVTPDDQLQIITQPKDYIGAVGETATFTVQAEGEGLQYQWQYSDNGGKKWTNSKSTDEAVTCKITETRDGRLYRCVITDRDGGTVVSNAAAIVIHRDPVITKQPEDYTGAVGEVATFTVKAEGVGLQYQWQYSDNGGKKWSNSSSVSATATCKVTAARDGRQYRCIITDQNGRSVTSGVATITVLSDGPAITKQPEDYTGAVGEVATFTVKAEGVGLQYQWQYSDNGGKKWSNSSSVSATATCKVTAVRDGRQYRCIITDQNGESVTSDVAIIVVRMDGPMITKQPENYTGAVGEVATFTVKAEGVGLQYQWQYSDNGGAKWNNSSSVSATATCKVTAARDGRQYRCIITDQNGRSITSRTAALTVGK